MSRRANVVPLLFVLLVLAACGGPRPPWSEPPREAIDLRVAVSTTSVHLLEPVTVTLDAWRRDGVEIDFAPQVDAKDFAVETTQAPEQPFAGGRWQRTTLVLRPVRGPGELVLPSFVAKQKDGAAAASTPEQTITVTSALDGRTAELEAPGEPFPPSPRWGLWIAIATGALLVAALAFVWSRRGRRPRVQRDEVAVPPHVKALRALARLREAPRTTPAQVESFYVEVSNVLRVYLEERFGLRAPERTTEEFLRELESGEQLAREHRPALERFLSQCDLVKFAAFVPGESEHLAMHGMASQFVEATRPDRGTAAASDRPQAVHA